MSILHRQDGRLDRAEKAEGAPLHELEIFFRETDKEVLLSLARNRHLRERDLLRLLERKDLPSEVIAEVARHERAEGNYAVRMAIARHPRTPRRLSLPILKFLFLFDLVKVAQSPSVPGDVKIAAEYVVLKKMQTIPRGEKISLARRGPGRVAAALLQTADTGQIQAALENPYLTEAQVLKILSLENILPPVIEALAQNEKWSRRYYLRLALVRHPLTPLRLVLAWLPDLAVTDLREICLDHRMPELVRRYVLVHCAERLQKSPRNSR
jgi:hypothetical protein